MIRLCSVPLFVILFVSTQLAISNCRPQQRQFQGGFRPINALRFPDDQVQDGKRFPPPPPPPRRQQGNGRPSSRPAQVNVQRPPRPVQPTRDTRPSQNDPQRPPTQQRRPQPQQRPPQQRPQNTQRPQPQRSTQQRPQSQRPRTDPGSQAPRQGGQSRPQLNTRPPVQVQTTRRPPPQGPVGGQQRPQPNPRPQQTRPQRPNQRGPVIDDDRLPERAFSAPNLFVRPEFNVFGNPIMFDPPMIDQEEELPDFRRGKPDSKPKKRPKTNLGPDLQPRLPVFGQPDAILQATETLRNNDVNHESFLPLGVVNAGVLPLAVPQESKEPKSLGLFPPFAPF